jgi:hypothetical protein
VVIAGNVARNAYQLFETKMASRSGDLKPTMLRTRNRRWFLG